MQKHNVCGVVQIILISLHIADHTRSFTRYGIYTLRCFATKQTPKREEIHIELLKKHKYNHFQTLLNWQLYPNQFIGSM